jgi:hypothetical protein
MYTYVIALYTMMKYTKETKGPKVSKRMLSVFNLLFSSETTGKITTNIVGIFIGWFYE